jgi:hypothetical protein
VVAPHERAVAVEVDADLVLSAAPRAAALIGEGRQRRGLYPTGGLHVVSQKSVAALRPPSACRRLDSSPFKQSRYKVSTSA